jgi:ribonuclease P protein component
MLPFKCRLKKKKDIEKIFKEGKSFKEGFLILKTIKNSLDFCRFGFIVSKKISNKAVVRNNLKRKMREIVRANFQRLKIGSDNLLIALPGAEKEDFKNIKKFLEELFNKAKIII